MSRHILLIVEGAVTEPKVFGKIFKKYGFEVIKKGKLNKTLENSEYLINSNEYKKENNTITIVQGTHSMLNHVIKSYDANTDNFESFFTECSDCYNGIFFVYDVDHTTNENLERLSIILNNETEGMLLLSSPCLEILSEPKRINPIEVNKLREYKKERNIECHEVYKKDTLSYIIENFESLILYFLEQNFKDFNEPNIMNHPSLIINKINQNNIREESYVNYRYFTTVIYVCIAHALGLTKQIENYNDVYHFFKSKINTKEECLV